MDNWQRSNVKNHRTSSIMITEEYQYNDFSQGILVQPSEWSRMELQQLYGQLQLLQRRYNICVAEYPSLANPLLEGLHVLRNIIAEKEKIC